MNAVGKAIAAMAFALLCHPVHAQVYKCKGADGKTTYQQTPCGNAPSDNRVKIWAQPSEADVAAAKERMRDRENKNAQDAQPLYSRASSEQPNLQAQRERIRDCNIRYDKMLSDGRGKNSVKGLDWSQRHSQSIERDRTACLSGVSAPNEQTPSTATRTGPGYTEPRTIFDQHGNVYIQSPGSSFATDTKTGKQCVVSGGVIVSCN